MKIRTIAASLLTLMGLACSPDPGLDTPGTNDTGNIDPQIINYECPLDSGLEEQILEDGLSDLGLNIGGKSLHLETSDNLLATLFFGPKNSGGACVYGLSTGQLDTEHDFSLPLLRMGEEYELVVAFQDETGDRTSMSQVISFETEEKIQAIPEEIRDIGTKSEQLGFNVKIYGEVPDFNFTTGIITKVEGSAEFSGSQAYVFDSQGILVGNYIANESASHFPSIDVSFSGDNKDSYSSGNENLRINIGGGVAEEEATSIISLEGVVEDSIMQPQLDSRTHLLSHTHREIENTEQLENSSSVKTFNGRVFLSLIYEMGQDGASGTQNAVIYDQAKVNLKNNQDIDAWEIWKFGSEDLPAEVAEVFHPNSLHYDPVRNEVIVRSKTDTGGGLILGIGVDNREVNWIFGQNARDLEEYLSDTIIIDEVTDPGLCVDPFSYGAHNVTIRHDGDDPDDFFLGMHDNGEIETEGNLHTRAMVYRVQLDEVNKTGQIDVHWAYPSNPLSEDDPMANDLNYFNSGFGSMTHLGGEIYLLASGLTDDDEEGEENPLGLETRDHLVLLEGKPDERSAEVLAIYSLMGEINNSIYSVDAGFLYHTSERLETKDGSFSFDISQRDD